MEKNQTIFDVSVKIRNYLFMGTIFLSSIMIMMQVGPAVYADEASINAEWKVERNMEEAMIKDGVDPSLVADQQSYNTMQERNAVFEVMNPTLAYEITDRDSGVDRIRILGFKAVGANASTLTIVMHGMPEVGSNSFYVTEIANGAFYRKALTAVNFERDNAYYRSARIGDYAFADNLLTTIRLPDTVTEVGNGAFELNNLITVTGWWPRLREIGEFAFSSNQLINIPIATANLMTIKEGAFYKNNLTNITLNFSHYGVREIGRNAFGENKLTSVVIPDTVTSLGMGAFYDNLLKDVKIGTGISRLEQAVFAYNELEKLTIPNTINYVGTAAFRGNQLRTVTIPESVETIKMWAFRDNQLSQVNLLGNETVQEVGEGLFIGNPLDVIHIEMPSSLEYYSELFSPATMVGVTKRTIIGSDSGVDYAAGTSDYTRLPTNGDLELNVVYSIIYQLNNLSEYVWETHSDFGSSILIEWFKDGKSLERNGGSIMIPNVTTYNSGLYHARLWLPWLDTYRDLPYIRVSVDPIF